MTNEEAADALKRLIYPTHAPYHNEVIRLAIAALRTPPATGAAAMREACLEAVRKCNVIGERGTEGNWFGGVLAALEQAEADMRALPAPEVPEAVREWAYKYDITDDGSFDTAANVTLRDWIRKEYGL